MLKKALSLLVILIAIAAAGGVVAWVVLTEKAEEAEPADAPLIDVEVRLVRALERMPDDFELFGVVAAQRVVKVAAEVAGRVEKLQCKEGADCKAGDVLVQLNTDLLQAELDRAQVAHKLAQDEYTRVKKLKEDRLKTPQDLERAEAELGTAEATLRLARLRLDRAAVRAPVGGVLNDTLVEEGEFVQPGMPVVEIVEIDRIKIVVPVPERDVSFMAVGKAAEILANVRGVRRTYTGAVTYISEVADQSTRATRVEIELENKGRLLHSGLIVEVRLTRRTLRDIVLVPLAAVIPLEHGHAVYVDAGGVAERREVRINTRFIRTVRHKVTRNGKVQHVPEQRVQILPWPQGDGRRGVLPGDRLIVVGHQFVAPGQALNVKQQTSSPTLEPAGHSAK